MFTSSQICVILTLLLSCIEKCHSQRHWSDFLTDLGGIDDPKFPEPIEKDAMKITQQPSEAPTSQPSISLIPTLAPSLLPTESPTAPPTSKPSTTPTLKPSSVPTISPIPTIEPTSYPTFDQPSTAFSFNPDAKHGPPRWDDVNPRNFKQEYDRWNNRLDFEKNECDRDQQSPISLYHNAKCVEFHQIRTRRGDYNFDETDFRILPNALRMDFPQEIEFQKNNDTFFRLPPQADFPDGWPRCDAKHLEIKVPSEHRIYGRQYDGELTITHITGDRPITIAVMLDSSKDIRNRKMQALIDEWEEVFASNKMKCDRRRRLMKGENVTMDQISRIRPMKTKEELAELFPIEMDDEIFDTAKENIEDDLFSGVDEFSHDDKNSYDDDVSKFDDDELLSRDKSRHLEGQVFESAANSADYAIYQILPTIWFFGYEGSFTVPPCSRMMHWRVLESPIDISVEQLKKIQTMLFEQVDSRCRRTTVMYGGGVNRPIQNDEQREVWHCTERDFGPDVDSKWTDLNVAFFPERDY